MEHRVSIVIGRTVQLLAPHRKSRYRVVAYRCCLHSSTTGTYSRENQVITAYRYFMHTSIVTYQVHTAEREPGLLGKKRIHNKSIHKLITTLYVVLPNFPLLGSSYSPAVTLLFFYLFLVLDRHDYRVTECVHRRNTGRTSRIATLLCCLSVLASRVVILFR